MLFTLKKASKAEDTLEDTLFKTPTKPVPYKSEDSLLDDSLLRTPTKTPTKMEDATLSESFLLDDSVVGNRDRRLELEDTTYLNELTMIDEDDEVSFKIMVE